MRQEGKEERGNIKNGWRDGECVGCASQLMQNWLELGLGGRGGRRERRLERLHGEVSHINVTTSNVRRINLKRQLHSSATPPHSKTDTLYSLGCPLQLFLDFFIFLFFALQGGDLSIG